jgi:hypothetical protein
MEASPQQNCKSWRVLPFHCAGAAYGKGIPETIGLQQIAIETEPEGIKFFLLSLKKRDVLDFFATKSPIWLVSFARLHDPWCRAYFKPRPLNRLSETSPFNPLIRIGVMPPGTLWHADCKNRTVCFLMPRTMERT